MPETARAACLRALVRWEKGRAFADEILHETLQTTAFAAVDRAFLMETFFGILRNLSELDFLLGQLRSEPVDSQTRAVLRLGLYQLFHMRIPSYAAVNETVALAGRARGLVNAILRRALREEQSLQQKLAGAAISVRTSHPEFLIFRWTKIFGRDATEKLAAWNNFPAPVYVRANGLKVTPGELLRALPHAVPSAFHPSALKVEQLPFRAVMRGLCYVQDPSTLMACDLLAPSPGETVLDACAAPGGKTTYLAELMQNEGRLIACDLYASRLARLRENVARLGAQIVEPLQLDAMRADTPLAASSFDRILVDAPCSNTGVIRRRVDVRWRLTDEDFIRMPTQQLALLRRMAPLLKPGGAMVYSTCSLEPEENEQVVQAALRENPSLRFVESRCTHPFVHEIDGAFAAKFIRK